MSSRRIVTVFGSAAPRRGEQLYETARQVGAGLARLGLTVCNGGYGGTMEATARGAREAGGHTIGITCRALGRPGANAYIREVIETTTLTERLETLLRLGRAYVVLPGGTGTLAELALCWEMRNKGLIEAARPLVLLGDWWRPVVDCVARVQPADLVTITADVDDLLETLARHFDADA